jgi:hypothetical protein
MKTELVYLAVTPLNSAGALVMYSSARILFPSLPASQLFAVGGRWPSFGHAFPVSPHLPALLKEKGRPRPG